MTILSKDRFDRLCGDLERVREERDSDRIGTYQEKELHKILKRTVCEDPSCFEIPIGSYVADVLREGIITEIQTGGFYPLLPKLKFFLEDTDYDVTVVHPMVKDLTLIRVEKETGEILRKKRSPKKESAKNLLSELFYLREVFPSPRLKIVVALISAEEYRYSERMRNRKKGAYDAKFVPLSLLETVTISSLADVETLLPETVKQPQGISAKEFGSAMGLKEGRRRSAALSFLCQKDILIRCREGRCYRYFYKT